MSYLSKKKMLFFWEKTDLSLFLIPVKNGTAGQVTKGGSRIIPKCDFISLSWGLIAQHSPGSNIHKSAIKSLTWALILINSSDSAYT